MKNSYLLFLLILINSVLSAQTIVFSDAFFKAKLLQSGPESTIARNLSDDYFDIDANNNGEIEISEALQVAHLDVESSSINSLLGVEKFTNLVSLQCSNNKITNLNIGNLIMLTDLNCNNNSISSLTLTGAIGIQSINCRSNQLVVLDARNLANLINLDCSDNKINTLILVGLNKLEYLTCTSNALATLNLSDLTNLLSLECNRNLLNSIALSNLTNVENLNCSFNQLTSLDVSTLIELNNLECNNNQLETINVFGLTRLLNLNCNFNKISSLAISTLSNITFLYCNNNKIETLHIGGLIKLRVLDFSKNEIASIDTLGLTNLQYVYASNNKLVLLDLTNQTELKLVFVANNLLYSLFLKNDSIEETILISGNPMLRYICADESQIEFVQQEVLNNGYADCVVHSYCTFAPSGNYYTIVGKNTLDGNGDGCNALDSNFQNLKLAITDGATATTYIPDTTGNFAYDTKEGTYSVTPVLENPTYYTISPASYIITLPEIINPYPAPFCFTPIANKKDLEVTLMPLNNARSGQDSEYKIFFRNKGTVTQSGTVNLSFDQAALNLVSANPTISSQTTANLNWAFSNLKPQESQTIILKFSMNKSLKAGYLLNFKSNITNTSDETPLDNSSNFSQAVASQPNSNDKICLEGDVIAPSKVGEYLHYMIRYKNSGSATVGNIVVKDLIDTSKLDISTLVPLHGSHPFVTKITNNSVVEFIFENINLSFEPNSNTGYVLFKIRTIVTLQNGNEIKNTANLYFDNLQIKTTNEATTSIETLQVQERTFIDSFTIYPNPVKNILHLENKNESEINSISIYNTLGQLLQTHITTVPKTITIDVSQLKSGIYLIKIISNLGSQTFKFIKE